jgi:hypothetical protein
MLTSKTGVEPTNVRFEAATKKRFECENTLVNGWIFYVFVFMFLTNLMVDYVMLCYVICPTED